MTAYQLTVLRKQDLAEITIKCAKCSSKLSLSATEHVERIQACACGAVVDEAARKVIKAFYDLHAALEHTASEFEFPVQTPIE